jgi:Golgi SNAP receptor complex protein 1
MNPSNASGRATRAHPTSAGGRLRACIAALAGAASLAWSAAAWAQSASPAPTAAWGQQPWSFSLTPYAWLPTINANIEYPLPGGGTGGGATGGTATAMHMLQRHREILHDFQQEFNKCKASVKASTERDQLLSSVRQDIREHRCKEATNSETQLRERNAIQGADRGAEDVLSVAHATREALAAQRSTFGGMSSKLTQLSAIAPQVDALLGRIGLRKKRDKMILAVVVGLCSGLLFVSAFG